VTASQAPDLVLLGERGDDIQTLAARGTTAMRRALDAVIEATNALAGNANAMLVVERLLLELRVTERSFA